MGMTRCLGDRLAPDRIAAIAVASSNSDRSYSFGRGRSVREPIRSLVVAVATFHPGDVARS